MDRYIVHIEVLWNSLILRNGNSPLRSSRCNRLPWSEEGKFFLDNINKEYVEINSFLRLLWRNRFNVKLLPFAHYTPLTVPQLTSIHLSPSMDDCFCYCGDEVRLRLCATRPLTGPLHIPQMIHEWIWNSGGIILTGENRRTWWKNLFFCLFVHRKSHMDCPGYLASVVTRRD
jgi:hypothetical protein